MLCSGQQRELREVLEPQAPDLLCRERIRVLAAFRRWSQGVLRLAAKASSVPLVIVQCVMRGGGTRCPSHVGPLLILKLGEQLRNLWAPSQG